MEIVEKIVCPWCEIGTLVDEQYDDQIRFGRALLTVTGLLRQRCDECGGEMTDSTHIVHNSELIRAAERKSSCFVSPAMLRAFREKYALSQKEAGRLLGVGEGAFGKYETGSRLSAPTAKLIRVALHLPEAARLLGEEEGMEIVEVQATNVWTGSMFRLDPVLKEIHGRECRNDVAYEKMSDVWKSVPFEGPKMAAFAWN